KAPARWLWRGRTVKLVDGTGLSMPDTQENQARYPQPSTQAPGVGFPLARLVVVVCLATGAALDAAIGPHQGKGSGELALVRRWNIELDLRNLKTTTGMDVLRCQTPQMNDKQLWVHLLAYNVIRLLMARAASHVGIDPRGLSFKHTVQLWTEWVSRGLSVTKD